MIQSTPSSTGALWARFRFSVVGSLLSSPPARGALQAAIRSLAEKTWSHPVTGRDVSVAAEYHRVAGITRRSASATTRLAPYAVPYAKTAARSRWRRPSLSDFISSTVITRAGASNCTTTTSPRW